MKQLVAIKRLTTIDEIEETAITGLKDINLTIDEGDFVAVLGDSDSGKSTLMYAISGLKKATTGSIVFNNRLLDQVEEFELAEMRLKDIGYVFQQNNLLKNLTLFSNIVMPAYHLNKESRQVVNKRGRSLMKHLGIEELEDKNIAHASECQLQKVEICRALINQPKMLIADEPTGGLNSKDSKEIMAIFSGINRSGTTIILVTHDLKVAAWASRVIFMMAGTIIAEKQLGSIAEDENERREVELANWLEEQGVREEYFAKE